MDSERAIRRLKWRLKGICALRSAVWWASFTLIAWGTLVVVARLLGQPNLSWLLAGIVVVIGTAIGAAYRAWLRTPSDRELLALLDAANACGGLLMSRQEVPIVDWSPQVRMIPEVTWKKRPAFAVLIASLVYVALGLLLPQQYLRPASGQSLAAQRQIERLQEQLDKLHELGLIEPERCQQIAAELKEICNHASWRDPSKTHEALDHLATALKQLAEAGADQRCREHDQLQQARLLSEALQQLLKTSELKPNQLQLAEQALKKLLQQSLSGRSSAGNGKELQELLDRHKNGTPFTEEELAELADKLENLLEADVRTLEDLAVSGLIDPKSLEHLKQATLDPKDIEELKRCLKKGEGDCDADELVALLAKARTGKRSSGDSKPANLEGSGSIVRGRQDADLTCGEPSSTADVQLKPEALKPGELHRLDATVVRVERGKPTSEERQVSQGGAITGPDGSAEGHQRQILPRHRGSVRRYFHPDK